MLVPRTFTCKIKKGVGVISISGGCVGRWVRGWFGSGDIMGVISFRFGDSHITIRFGPVRHRLIFQ